MKFLRKLSWSAAAQALSSVSNLLLSIFAAQGSSLPEFGAYGIGFAIYQFGLGASRAFIGDPVLIRANDPDALQPTYGGTLTTSLVVSAPCSAICLAIAAILPEFSAILIVFASTLPVVLAIDSLRYCYFANNRPQFAALIDTSWLVLQCLTFLTIVLAGVAAGVIAALLSWLCGASSTLFLYFILTRTKLTISGAFVWIKSVRSIAFRFFGEYLTISGTQQGIIAIAVFQFGLGGSAAVRAGQVVVGPLSILSMGVAVVILPALARKVAGGRVRGLLSMSALISACLVAATAMYGFVISLLPQEVGIFLLDANWIAGLPLFGLLLMQIAVSNLSYGAVAALRSLQAAKVSFRLRLVWLPVTLGLMALGSTYSLEGIILGAIVGSLCQAVSWWIVLPFVIRRRHGTEEEPT